MMFAMTMVMMMMAWVTHIVASCSITNLGLDAILVITLSSDEGGDDDDYDEEDDDNDDDYLHYVHLPANVIFATDEVAGKENHRFQFYHQFLIRFRSAGFNLTQILLLGRLCPHVFSVVTKYSQND